MSQWNVKLYKTLLNEDSIYNTIQWIDFASRLHRFDYMCDAIGKNVFVNWPRTWSLFCWITLSKYVFKMCLKTYTEAEARRAGSRLVTGCTGGCHFDTVRCGQGGMGLSLWWPSGRLRLPDLVHILSSLFVMNITEMIGISSRIVLRCFHGLMFLLCWEIKNFWFLIPVEHRKVPNRRFQQNGRHFVWRRFWRFPLSSTPPPTLKKIKHLCIIS